MGNRQDSSDSEKTISDDLVGFGDQKEVGSVKMFHPVAEGDSTDSERTHTARHGQISRDDDAPGDYFEADSGHRKAGNSVTMRVKGNSRSLEILRSSNKVTRDSGDGKILQNTRMDTETGYGINLLPKGKIVIPTRRGVLKLLPKNNIVATKTSDRKNFSKKFQKEACFRSTPNSGHQDYYIGAASGSSQAEDRVVGAHAGVTNLNIAPQNRVKYPKKYLNLPPWLIDYKSNIDLDGWLHWEVHGTGRTDKYYAHRDYACTFRSIPDVIHFIETGEFKGKVVKKKRSADPSGEDSGPSRSTRTRP